MLRARNNGARGEVRVPAAWASTRPTGCTDVLLQHVGATTSRPVERGCADVLQRHGITTRNGRPPRRGLHPHLPTRAVVPRATGRYGTTTSFAPGPERRRSHAAGATSSGTRST